MFRLTLIAGLCCSALALAQTNPDEEWGGLPVNPNAPPPPPPSRVPAPLSGVDPLEPPPAAPGEVPRAGIGIANSPPVEPNTVSMFGGPTLGQWKRGQAIFLGFPLLGIKLSIGLLDRLDFSIGFESFYGVMNEFHAGFKIGIFRGTNWSMSATVEGMLALFGQRATQEVRGPRWLTGHRNYGGTAGVILSYQGDSPRAARLFLDARYLLSYDTEIFAKEPLSGLPSPVGHNILVHFGAEMPLSARTSFVFLLGLDIHGRSDDAVVMPVASLGLVTGL